MDRDTKRWIFDTAVWMAGILAFVLLVTDAAARGGDPRAETTVMPHAASTDLEAPGAVRG